MLMALVTFAAMGACKSRLPAGYLPLPPSDRMPSLAVTAERTCFAPATGSFLADLKAVNMPPVALEGTWDKKFQEFTAQVLSPLGEALAKFEFRAGTFYVTLNDTSNAQRDEINAFAGLMASIGPQALRAMACGLHVAKGQNEKYFKPATRVELDDSARTQYASQLEFALPEHLLQVDSLFSITESAQKFDVKAKSTFEGGLFNSNVAKVDWEGTWSKTSLTPRLLKISSSEIELILGFSEFD